jgi:hypothetical protein
VKRHLLMAWLTVIAASFALTGGFVATTALAGDSASTSDWTCSGATVTLLNNTNTGAVANGGGAPTFSTHGQAYCVALIQTYHWNDGDGSPPGTLGLERLGAAKTGFPTSLGPYKALTSSGQNNAPNVNWYVYPPFSSPQLIDGTYTCDDSEPSSWSSNDTSGHHGFCIVRAVPAVQRPSTTGTTKVTTTTPCEPGDLSPPPECQYDLAVSISAPSQIHGDVPSHRFDVEVTVTNNGPAVSPHASAGLSFGPSFVPLVKRAKDGTQLYDDLNISKVPPDCTNVDLNRGSSQCTLHALSPHEKQSFTFAVLWGARAKGDFNAWSAAGKPATDFSLSLESSAYASSKFHCKDVETECKNNEVTKDVPVVQ